LHYEAPEGGEVVGSLSYKPRGNLSIYTGMYYIRITNINKEILDFREAYSLPAGRQAHQNACPPKHCVYHALIAKEGPFCPVIFGGKFHNSLMD